MSIFKNDVDGEGQVLNESADRSAFLKWAEEELVFAEQELEPHFEKCRTWRRQREALPESAQRDYPWTKSSNVCPPVALTVTQTAYGNAANTFDVRDCWSVRALNDSPALIAQAKVLTKYFRIISDSPTDLNKRKKDRTILYETVSLGTLAVKVPYTVTKYNVVETLEGQPSTITVTLHDGPDLQPIPTEDFLYRAAYPDIQSAPWVAHIVHRPWHELKNGQNNGEYENVDEIEEYYRSSPTEEREEENENIGVEELQNRTYDLVEFYFFFDPVGDGIYRDCIVTFERSSLTVLKERYNELGRRPFAISNYLNRPFRLEGLGCGHYSEQLQVESEMLHNTRNDGIHISLAQMFAVRKGSGVRLKETVFPGKVWMLDDPKNDIVPIRAGEVYPSSLAAEQTTLSYAQKASGMTDALSGFSDATLKTRDSIGLQSQRMKQGLGIFGAVTQGLVEFYGEVGMLIMYQLVRNREGVIAKEERLQRLSKEDIATLRDALNISLADLPLKLAFTVKTSDMDETAEAKRQNILMQTQLYGMFTQKIIPLLGQIASPQLPPEVKQAMARLYVGTCKMMEDTMKFFGEADTSDYIPEYKKYDMMLDLMKALQEQNMSGQALGAAVQTAQPALPAMPAEGTVEGGVAVAGGGGAGGQPGGGGAPGANPGGAAGGPVA